MKPDCLLHIGVPKTGSTSIQVSLKQGSGILAEAGVLYPALERNHRFLVSAFMTDPDSFDYNRMAGRSGAATVTHNTEMLAELETEIAAAAPRLVILSAEHSVLLGADEVTALKSWLEARFAAIRILVYVRDPVQQALSMIQEQVKNGAARLADCLADPPTSHYKSLIDRWSGVFGHDAVSVCAYTGDLPGKPDIVGDFLSRAGLGDLVEQIPSIRQNDSLSGAGLLLADALSEFAPKFSRNRLLQRKLPQVEGPKYVFPGETLDRIVEKTKTMRDYLETAHGLRFADIDTSIPPPAPETYFRPETIRSLALLFDDLANVAIQAKKKRRDSGPSA
ncbi:hypothetical protein LCL97_21780 [Seohaeicola saemankumensis]|nr:hypothetical protein [Seohaeicola saemankumensis]MCA0873470.1 hypothetical protein [Seohaeicola saemankumensis]